jgi:hypothetical protein
MLEDRSLPGNFGCPCYELFVGRLLDLEGNAITSISSTSFPSSLMFVSLAFLTFCISLSFVLVRGLTARPDALFAAQQTPVTQGESNLLNQWRYDYTEVLRC